MSSLIQGIDAIIFDIGNVLIDLDYPQVIRQLSRRAQKNQHNLDKLVVDSKVLRAFELGQIGPDRFREEVAKLLGCKLAESEFEQIWNSMLKEVSRERMSKILKIKQRYKTYILSNTNLTHELAFEEKVLEATGRPSIRDFVEQAFFSHEIGMRKPDAECFEFVIDEIDLYPSRMLFLDDRLENVQAAKKAGMKSFQIQQPDKQLSEIFQV